jgi:hypothetical protein
MSKRSSGIDRLLAFYREGSPDLVRVVHTLASEIVEERGIGKRNGTRSAKGTRTYTRKSKLPATGVAGGGTQVSGGQSHE